MTGLSQFYRNHYQPDDIVRTVAARPATCPLAFIFEPGLWNPPAR